MFGYVRVSSADLRVREYEFYRGAYCGLCRSMGKCTGQCSRMTLNYDFVFLTVVRLALAPEEVCFEQKRCFVHPLKKRNSMKRNSALDFCAGAAAILNYHKIADDLLDEKGFRRLRALMARPMVSHARRKAIKRAPELRELDLKVADGLRELSDIEAAGDPSVDIPADCFGRLLGEIVAFGLEGAERRIAYQLGRNIGAWIYIADAIDDMREDAEKGRYNPFIKLYGGRLPSAEELGSVALAIRNHLYGAEAAVDLMDTESDVLRNIIQNAIYLGIPDKTDEMIKKHNGEDIKDPEDPKDIEDKEDKRRKNK